MTDVAAIGLLGAAFAGGFASGFGLRAMISRRRRFQSRRAAGLV